MEGIITNEKIGLSSKVMIYPFFDSGKKYAVKTGMEFGLSLNLKILSI